jgi:hypothetical protein
VSFRPARSKLFWSPRRWVNSTIKISRAPDLTAPSIAGLIVSQAINVRLSIFCAAIVFATPAAAEMDADVFLKYYDAANLENRQLYERILGATENGISWASAKAMNDGQRGIFCPPNKLALTDQQSVDILRRHVLAHTDHAKVPYGLVLLLALQETFPCK